MRLYNDNLIAVISADGFNNAERIVNGFLKNRKAISSKNGEIRSVIVKEANGEYFIYFSNLSSKAVNTHFTRQGFIFI